MGERTAIEHAGELEQRVLAAAPGDTYRLLVDSVLDDAICLIDGDGHIAIWNAGAERIHGFTADEIVGQPVARLYADEEVQAGVPGRALREAVEQGCWDGEGWRVRRDGSRFFARVTMRPLRTADRQLVGVAQITRDLTERRRAEAALSRSQETFRLLVDSVKDYAIFMLDPRGFVTTWNAGAQLIKGYRAGEIIGQHFSKFYPPEIVATGLCEMELEVAAAEGRFEQEGWRVRKDGSRFWANVVITALRDVEGRLVGFAKVTRDLTERRRAEQERIRLAQAQEANRFKDEFLATISHELRTPLNAILGWSSLLATRATDPSAARAAETIRRNAQAQAKIVEDVLDVSRIVMGKLRLEPRQMDLVAVVREALDVVRPTADAKGIQLDVEHADATALLVADPARMQQVVWNLLSNAVKFTDEGGAVHVRVDVEEGRIELVVRDTGKGIEPDFLPHVFERFRQADSSTTRQHGGLGLGLAIVRHIVELSGGRVSVESEGPGRGSTFRVVLPVRSLTTRSEAGANGRTTPTSSPCDVRLDGIRVLVVDDDGDARELLHTLLEGRGAVVELAASADEGRRALARFGPDVVVSDIAMPAEDGYDFIQSVRALPAARGGAVHAIAVTAYARAEDRARAVAAGYDGHVTKPIQDDDLARAVQASLATGTPS